MTDHKFTDDENVISILEFCVALHANANLTPENVKALLDIINRQKAQIESLNAIHADMTESLRLAAEANKDMQAAIEKLRMDRYQLLPDGRVELIPRTDINAIKAEAIKEFAERLKENETKSCSWCVHSKHGTRSEKCDNFFPTHQRAYCLNYDRWKSKIDTLAKEMTEENK